MQTVHKLSVQGGHQKNFQTLNIAQTGEREGSLSKPNFFFYEKYGYPLSVGWGGSEKPVQVVFCNKSFRIK